MYKPYGRVGLAGHNIKDVPQMCKVTTAYKSQFMK